MDNSLHLHDGSSLATRQVSGFAISLPTGLALESMFPRRIAAYDPDRKIPQLVNLTLYSECWISLTTLFRNMVSSMDRTVAESITPEAYRDALETEIDVINGLFMNEGNNLCKPKFYVCTYKGLRAHLPSAIALREDKTNMQMAYTHKQNAVMKLLRKTNDEVYEFDYEIKPNNARSNAILITHHPYDLLSYTNFNKLDLLESNTGKLKSKHNWNTKYYPVGSDDMSILPFTRKLLLIFGDRVQIQPSDIKLRRLIIEIAQKCKWTSVTTDAKIAMDLQSSIMEPYVLQLLAKL
jgi:hypothetical protein